MDKVQIQQVIVNLLRNAVEALDGRDVREITVASEAEGDRHIAIEVRDTGPGVAPEMLERLFQPFATTKQEGMGIGLSICRKIVESHGGRLTYHPNPRGGAVFRLSLLLAEPGEAAA
jgi:two-component system sensor kinase FixL